MLFGGVGVVCLLFVFIVMILRRVFKIVNLICFVLRGFRFFLYRYCFMSFCFWVWESIMSWFFMFIIFFLG